MSRIGITVNNVLGGPREVAINLIPHLAKIDKKNEYILLSDSREQQVKEKNFSHIYLPRKSKYLTPLWDHASIPFCLKNQKIDILHHTKAAHPLGISIPTIVSIYDMAPILFPETFSTIQGLYSRFNYKVAAKKASVILTVSESSKRDIIEILKVPDYRVKCIYPGINEKIKRIKDPNIIQMTRGKYKLPKDYILYLGTIHPRKNLNLLISAYHRFKKEVHCSHELVIAGRIGWKANEILSLVKKYEKESPITMCGPVAEEDKSAVYSGASVFVSPSLYEGFGLTIAEAMRCKTPVITSNVSSIPEVIGKSGVLIDPLSTDELISAMSNLITDEKYRIDLGIKGFEQSKRFSWDICARRTLQVYSDVSGV